MADSNNGKKIRFSIRIKSPDLSHFEKMNREEVHSHITKHNEEIRSELVEWLNEKNLLHHITWISAVNSFEILFIDADSTIESHLREAPYVENVRIAKEFTLEP